MVRVGLYGHLVQPVPSVSDDRFDGIGETTRGVGRVCRRAIFADRTDLYDCVEQVGASFIFLDSDVLVKREFKAID